jgi:hypothetical protein
MPNVTSRALTPLTNPTGTAIGASAGEGPGFYQGIVGRKTGRAAPRPGGHGRTAPRHEMILAEHGLLDKGAADPNQGQLFGPSELPPKESPRESALRMGTPPPLASSRPGFMPGLYESKTKEGPGIATTAQAHKRMIGAIERLPAYEMEDGVALGAGNTRVEASGHRTGPGEHGPNVVPPVAEALRQRMATAAGHPADVPWYASRTETTPQQQIEGAGKWALGPGEATDMITNASARHGIGYEKMARVVALTSPRTAWTAGMRGTSDFAAPNLESAENVVHDVQAAQHSSRVTDRSVNYAEVGHAAEGRSLGEMKAKAAVDYVESDPASAIRIGDLSSQKVPNFNQALLQHHPSQAVQRQSALSYTVDTHDVSSQNSSVDLLKTPGGYAIAHMVGRRAALKNRELPSMSQSRIWMGQKEKTAEPIGKNSLFEETRSGKLRPNPRALPSYTPPVSAQFDNRSPTAKRLGIEF